MKDEYDFSSAERGKFFREGARLVLPARREMQNRPTPADLDKFWADLDALGANDFLQEGILDDPPAEPDPRVFTDDDPPQ